MFGFKKVNTVPTRKEYLYAKKNWTEDSETIIYAYEHRQKLERYIGKSKMKKVS